MNILVMTSMAWDTTNSIGNTLANWFSGKAWKRDNFSHLYLRKQLPNNEVCRDYYHMSVFEMANLLRKSDKIGRHFQYDYRNDKRKDNGNEGGLISALHKMPFDIIYWEIDVVYRQKRWKNPRFEKYISDVNPDIVFICVTDVSFISNFVNYIKCYTKAKIVSYVPDDTFSQLKSKPLYRRKRLLAEYSYVMGQSDEVLCASEKLKEYYEFLFKRSMKTIYKGCKISRGVNESVGSPLTIIYAGNLFYGRDKVLYYLVKTIEDINSDGQKYYLKIFCGDDMPQRDKDVFSIPGVSEFCGKREHNEVCKVQSVSDFSLIAESFDEKYKTLTRYSFSTKIPDALQSGSNVIAIGPSDVSSISYLQDKKFAFVVDDLAKVKECLMNIYDNRDILIDMRNEAKEFAAGHFEYEVNCERIREIFECVLE